MKKCPKCSKEFTDDFVYCTACNTPLEKVEQTTNTDTKNTQSETAYTQSTQTPQQNTQTTDTSPIQQVPQGNNNPNKKYIITIIIAAIIIIILLFTKCSSSDEPTQKDSTVVTTAPVTEQQSATPVPIATPTPEPLPTPTPAPVAKEFIRENYGYVDYKELARNPDPYKGKRLTYSGKVIQVIEGDTETQHRIAVNGDYDNVIYVAYPKNIVTSRILDDDYVTVYGTSLGLYSYQSTMGGKITVPALYLDRIELQQ